MQVFTYWFLVKFDVFNYATGMMVATRDNKSFSHPGAKAAAAAVETKAFEAAIADGMATVEKLAHKSGTPALSRVSQSLALQRKSLVTPSHGGLQRKSLISVDESNAAVINQIDKMRGDLEQASKENPEIQPHFERVAAAADRLKRVSQAVERHRQRHTPSSLEGTPRAAASPKQV
jgi:hypothetical protein